ncbi:DUF2254 domain-containing protein [Brachybacterium avium]|uniref:DUF2254 domain-containing protein n=1 Tax=Brachybacterium avium TaxID=2017485 RepID=UPI001FEA672F|nr:DUF2254 domain-containing protein [Brachybacterium avium]
MACSIAAVVLGVGLPQLEEALDVNLPYVFQGGPDGARGLLGTIATGMISMTGLVFSITMVILQLASSQFTPRVLGGFLESRITQFTLGVFIASFVFALAVTRSVRGEYGNTGEFVPKTSVTLAFLLVLASVGCFLAFIHHITTSIQVSHVISRIGDRSLELAEALYPGTEEDEGTGLGPTWSPDPGTPRVAVSTEDVHGVITQVDYERLVELARGLDVVVLIDREVGQFLAEGQHLFRVWGTEQLEEADRARLWSTITLGHERQMHQDVGFGIRQLVDIAERALSPGINDPTTAVKVIDELHRVLRHLVRRQSPSPYIADEDGRVRVVHRPQSIEGHLSLAVDEISHYGEGSVQVPRRLRAMLEDLQDVALDRYRPRLGQALERLAEPTGHAVSDSDAGADHRGGEGPEQGGDLPGSRDVRARA